MTDAQRPSMHYYLAILAIVSGFFSCIWGLLKAYGSVPHLTTASSIMLLIFGLIFFGVGVLGIISGIMGILNRKGNLDTLKKYSIAIIILSLLWIIHVIIMGGRLSIGTVFVMIAIGISILVFYYTRDEGSEDDDWE